MNAEAQNRDVHTFRGEERQYRDSFESGRAKHARNLNTIMSDGIREAGEQAIEELGLTHEESQLQNLAVYIHALEQENSALRQRVDLLSPMRKREPVMA